LLNKIFSRISLFGRTGGSTEKLIDYVSKRIAVKKDLSFGETKSRLRRRLAFRVMARVGDSLVFRKLRPRPDYKNNIDFEIWEPSAAAAG
jgi:hypothetical protein